MIIVLFQTNSEYHCAKMKEQAAYMCRDSKQMDKCFSLIQLSADHYRNCGQSDVACQCLEKLAKSIDQNVNSSENDKYTSIALLKNAFQMGQTSSRPRDAVQALDYASKILVSLNQFSDALEICETCWSLYEDLQNNNMLFRTGLHIALLSLELGLLERAKEMSLKMQRVDDELASELAALVEAFTVGDQKRVKEVTAGQNFIYTENEFAKLSQNLKVSEHLQMQFEAGGGRTLHQTGMAEFDEDDLS